MRRTSDTRAEAGRPSVKYITHPQQERLTNSAIQSFGQTLPFMGEVCLFCRLTIIMRRFILFLIANIVLVTAALRAQPPDTLWTQSIGGWDNDWCYSVTLDHDSGYLIAGQLSPDSGQYSRGALIRLDQTGQVIWSRIYDDFDMFELTSVAATVDGGYIAAGLGQVTHARIMKFDATGDVVWASWTPNYFDAWWVQRVLQTESGNYLLSTSGGSSQDGDIHLLLYDEQGDTLWTRAFGDYRRDRAVCLLEQEDGGFVILGSIAQPAAQGGSQQDVYILKTDADGIEQWSRIHQEPTDRWATAGDASLEGGFFVSGDVEMFGPNAAFPFCVKLSETGDMLWTREYAEFSGAIMEGGTTLPDGSYAMCGYWHGNIFLIIVNASGELVMHYEYEMSFVTHAWSVIYDPAGRLLIGGYRSTISDHDDMYVLSLDYVIDRADVSPNLPNKIFLAPCYPNPFNSRTRIEYAIARSGYYELGLYNMLGQRVRLLDSGFKPPASYQVTIDASDLPSGTYVCNLRGSDKSLSQTVYLVR